MNAPRIGSLCTGYGGLDTAVQRVFGGNTAWVSDIDPGACQIIAHRMPGVPNLGDLTTTDWAAVEPVDIVTGGYPCQPFSTAGLRKGTKDARHIWPDIARALGVLRPRVAIFENVANHLRIGFDTVLADLARLGFDAEWCLVRASEVGAPHRRERLFIYATAADAANLGHERGRGARGRGHGPAHHGQPAADAERLVPGDDRELPAGRDALRHGVRADAPRCGSSPAADAEGERRGEGRTEPAGQQGRSDAVLGSRAAATHVECVGLQGERSDAGADPGRASSSAVGRGPAGGGVDVVDIDWGRFAPAVARWEAVIGRRAPWATDDRNRLSPAFVEWLMGLPAGHVTQVPGLTRTQQLKALGNGVVPQQTEAAMRLLAGRATTPPLLAVLPAPA